ncbi:MAG: DMT family transporter [Alphaproteobacteria bacterium]|nr:DMT family transporter [Alphaproteobacteria bacterium]
MSTPSPHGAGPSSVLGPVIWCLAAAALFGASTPASKGLLDNAIGPLTLAGLLYLGAGLATLPFALSGGAAARRRDHRNLALLGGAVLFGGVLGPVALLVGLRTAPSASVSLWLNLETTATALLAWAFFKENMGARAWVANGLVVLAGLLLAAPQGFAFAPAAGLVVLACVCWGLDNNLTAVIDGFTPAQMTVAKGLVAGAVNLGLGIALEGMPPASSLLAAALAVGALSYGASIVLYIRGAQALGATRSQMLFATAPFLGVAVAWLGLGEPILWVQGAAAALMALALGLLLTDHHAHEHRHEPVTHTHAHRHDDGHHGHSHPDLPAEAWHTHEHAHEVLVHSHPHVPDLHHRHVH